MMRSKEGCTCPNATPVAMVIVVYQVWVTVHIGPKECDQSPNEGNYIRDKLTLSMIYPRRPGMHP